jgi:hypothetical protein
MRGPGVTRAALAADARAGNGPRTRRAGAPARAAPAGEGEARIFWFLDFSMTCSQENFRAAPLRLDRAPVTPPTRRAPSVGLQAVDHNRSYEKRWKGRTPG